jgi:hypothetical protein
MCCRADRAAFENASEKHAVDHRQIRRCAQTPSAPLARCRQENRDSEPADTSGSRARLRHSPWPRAPRRADKSVIGAFAAVPVAAVEKHYHRCGDKPVRRAIDVELMARIFAIGHAPVLAKRTGRHPMVNQCQRRTPLQRHAPARQRQTQLISTVQNRLPICASQVLCPIEHTREVAVRMRLRPSIPKSGC